MTSTTPTRAAETCGRKETFSLFFSYAVYPCLSVAGAGAGAGTGVAVWPKRDAKGVAAGDATAAAPPPGPNKSSMSSIAFCLLVVRKVLVLSWLEHHRRSNLGDPRSLRLEVPRCRSIVQS